MKRLFLLVASVALTYTASAEGYQVNTLSAKQLGMAHTGTALKLNSESLYFNPAAAAYQTSKFDISFGITGIKSDCTFSQNDYVNPVKKWKTDNKISTPLFLYFNYKPIENLSVGVSLTTPFGSAVNWGDKWAGAHVIQDISLTSYSVQPTVSYKFLNNHLSVGVGLMMTWGNFDLSRSMLKVGPATNAAVAYLLTQAGQGQAAAAITAVGDNPLVSAKLKGDAGLRVGINLGVMYDINEQWSLGFTYRSRMKMQAKKGTAQLVYANEQVAQILGATGLIPKLNEGTFTAELPLPTNLAWGVSFRPYDKWEFSGDIQWVGWSAYNNLNVSFNEKELKLEDINSAKNYKNTVSTRFGGQFFAFDWMTVRAGLYVDESPVRSDYLNPETPSMTKVAYTCGLSFMPGKKHNISIDLGYAYITSADPERTGSYPYENPLTKTIDPFTGNYALVAHALSFGVGMKF